MPTLRERLHDELFLFKSGDVLVKRSIDEDVKSMANRIRLSDVFEIWASDHYMPEEALKAGMEVSYVCLSIYHKELPVAMFGINPISLIGNSAIIWMLSTDELDEIAYSVAKHTKQFINVFHHYYPYLYNYVHTDNIKSINWLRYCGARFDEPAPYGVEQQQFMKFTFERK